MEVTTWAKRRQSEVRAVTQVKRLSLVTHPEADKVENLEGTSKLPQKARELETPAGSESTARAEMEAPWNLGDPPPSWSVHNGPSMSTEWTNLRETEATVEVGLAGSTQSAGKPRTWGRSEAG